MSTEDNLTGNGSSVDGSELPLKEVEGTEQNFQSRYDKAQKENAALKQTIQDIQSQFQELKQSIAQQQQAQPAQPAQSERDGLPPKPAGFNMVDAITEPDSASGKWYSQYQDYQMRLIESQNKRISELDNAIKQEKMLKLQQQQAEASKARTLALLTKEGLEAEDAIGAYDYMQKLFTMPIEDGAKELASLWKQKSTGQDKKTIEFDKKKAVKDTFIPGISTPSGSGATEDKAFFSNVRGKSITKNLIKT